MHPVSQNSGPAPHGTVLLCCRTRRRDSARSNAKTTCVEEKPVHDSLVAAACKNWEINKAHTNEDVGIIEAIVRDGMKSGEFRAADPRREARNVMTAFTPFYHPVLVEQSVRDGNDTGARLHDQITFLLGRWPVP
ncbi:hypothetical protein MRBLMR1_002259 [Neorhizobium sp. LMR1-1-1.1]